MFRRMKAGAVFHSFERLSEPAWSGCTDELNKIVRMRCGGKPPNREDR